MVLDHGLDSVPLILQPTPKRRGRSLVSHGVEKLPPAQMQTQRSEAYPEWKYCDTLCTLGSENYICARGEAGRLRGCAESVTCTKGNTDVIFIRISLAREEKRG